MGNIGPPKGVFTDTDLAQLEWVFQSVCSALDAAEAAPDEEEKASIRRRLVLLARNGMNDQEALSARLIENYMRSKKARARRQIKVMDLNKLADTLSPILVTAMRLAEADKGNIQVFNPSTACLSIAA